MYVMCLMYTNKKHNFCIIICIIYSTVPPSLKIKPQDQSIVENKEVTFHCTATGNPPPTITWIENGKTVAQGDSWSFIAKRNHSGKYWCSATNGLDKTTNSSAYLNVQCKYG